ncbi:hypothetical protein ASPACDRAFT_118552 [Aspergillus aculeatus ATCC 16872]|uniref:Nudix hydrolase domain-containing protein n=1 Tax=Aspergillus aculeatus (strain ATCC 16872 / CBS 172.66 / WB 5094) TaxID=690307 RepID=A0A1L9WVQ4_ASPA1|nr:uncharacterized protein ASPACDRAFT_118552 [Aspergillus aculeatus ATCC 16872]OJK00357.1 hypothetical protein ASPACDRAFT_118552 [Aspergillus aculeatus ATCC 16872]
MSTTPDSDPTTTITAPPAVTTIPRVGIAVLIFGRANQVLLGERKGSHGAGTWALPGGHLEPGETWAACAAREVLEETNLAVSGLRFLTATNDVMAAENKHYITIYLGCTPTRREACRAPPPVMEPEKCREWRWVEWEEVTRWYRLQDAAEKQHANPAAAASPAAGGLALEHPLFLPLMNLFRQQQYWMPLQEYQLLIGWEEDR